MAAAPKSKKAFEQGFRFPMLATALEIATKGVEKLPPGTWFAEEKFDGHRLIVSVDQDTTVPSVIGWSRTGLDTRESNRPLPPHIIEQMRKFPTGVYDGELIVPGGTSSDVADLLNQRKLVYVVFDVLQASTRDMVDMMWSVRRDYLDSLDKIFHVCSHVQLSSAIRVMDWHSAYEVVGAIWEKGGEGIILKRADAKYQCGKRTKTFLKLKGLNPLETTVVGFVPTSGEIMQRGMFATAVVQDTDGITTIVKSLDDEEIQKIASAFGTGIAPVFQKIRLSAGRNVEMIVNHPWVVSERKLMCEYTERTADGLYRHIRWDRWSDQ